MSIICSTLLLAPTKSLVRVDPEVAIVNSTSGGTTTGALSIAMPSGVLGGDTVLIGTTHANVSGTITCNTPGVVQVIIDGYPRYCIWRYTVVGSGDPTAFSFTTSTAYAAGVAVAVQGIVSPETFLSAKATTAENTSIAAPAVDVGTTKHIAFAWHFSKYGTELYTEPSNDWLKVRSADSGGAAAGVGLHCSYKIDNTGTTDNCRTGPSNGITMTMNACQIAFKANIPGTTPPPDGGGDGGGGSGAHPVFIGAKATPSVGGSSVVTGEEPVGTQQGDILLAFIANTGGNSQVWTQTGWTLFGTEMKGQVPVINVFQRIRGASAPDYKFTTSSTNPHQIIVIAAFRGGSIGWSSNGAYQTGTSANCGKYTLNAANETVIAVAAVAHGSAGPTVPSGYTEMVKRGDGAAGDGVGISVSYKEYTGIGTSTSNIQSGSAGVSDTYVGLLRTLKSV